jgi:Fe-S-cluster containining protein
VIDAFRRGLRFRCTRCGECCARLDGDIPLSTTDVRRISAHLGLAVRDFVDRYAVHVVDRVGAGEDAVDVPSLELRVPASGRCVFLGDDARCAINDVKPLVCARSPFVRYVAEGGPQAWAAAAYCPGLGTGERYSARRIARLLDEEAALDAAELERVARAGGDLGRVLGAPLPPPVVRTPPSPEGGSHGRSDTETRRIEARPLGAAARGGQDGRWPPPAGGGAAPPRPPAAQPLTSGAGAGLGPAPASPDLGVS